MRIVLLAPVQFRGAVHRAGSVIDWPKDVPLPTRHISNHTDHIDYRPGNDAVHVRSEGEDVPLYEILKETK